MDEHERRNEVAQQLRLTDEARKWCVDHLVGITPFNTIAALKDLGYLKDRDGERADGAALITEERRRQVEGEGWTPEHDDELEDFSLERAAASYALADWDLRVFRRLWDWDLRWWKPKSRLRNLIRAGALIAAAIDRLLRKARQLAALGDVIAGQIIAEVHSTTHAPESGHD